jgi:hypothetical protein
VIVVSASFYVFVYCSYHAPHGSLPLPVLCF